VGVFAVQAVIAYSLFRGSLLVPAADFPVWICKCRLGLFEDFSLFFFGGFTVHNYVGLIRVVVASYPSAQHTTALYNIILYGIRFHGKLGFSYSILFSKKDISI